MQKWKDKEIVIAETAGIPRAGEYVRVGVPFARGELYGTEGLEVVREDAARLPVQAQALGRWSDGSIKWLLVDFTAAVAANARSIYRLRPAQAAPRPTQGVTISNGDDLWMVATGPARFSVDARTLRPFTAVSVAGRDLLGSEGASTVLRLEGENTPQPLVETIVTECQGPLRAILRLEGRFGTGRTAPRFLCRLHFFAGSASVQLELSLHNPQAARHPGGLWDLGDSGSLVVKEFSLRFACAAAADGGRVLCSPAPGGEVVAARGATLRIHQASSGGENWRSPNHVTAKGTVELDHPGYRISIDGRGIVEGKRATPVLWVGEGDNGMAAVLPHFWQEFPKELAAGREGLKVGLFPDCVYLHELQGGEQKTTSLYLDFAAAPSALSWARAPLVAAPSPATCRESGVLCDLPPGPGAEASDLVDPFIDTSRLLQRREAIDEYGWRNFGEIYADHEAVYHKGDEPFISHYNNQYDLCAGLYRKFLATGEWRWGELAADLARHIRDIDIYHTDLDREEYNRGLFWHTDHYISAGRATHRSFSAVHLGSKDPRFFGGGPGAEHCYTSGLLLHYYLTGDPGFRDAVLSLADWSFRSLTGPRLVLSTLKSSLRYLSQLRHDGGSLFPRYPFTRGTGNAITASLDAFQLSGERRFLQRAWELIQGAVHPLDDIEARGLGNMETAWSYTVLLGALAKFLDQKCELGERDDAFAYAAASLKAYADWMVRHEFPYLQKAEFLEYPNETWAAQELRKCVVLYHAARYAPEERRRPYLEKARQLLETARADLERFPTSSCTRPVALMLQNGWIGSALEQEAPAALPVPAGGCFGVATPRVGGGAVLARLWREFGEALRETTPQRELAWLRSRLG